MQGRLRGYYKIAVKNKDGHVNETPWFENMILNQGLDAFGTSGSIGYGYVFTFIEVGTGTTPVTPNDTQLANFLARADNSGNQLSSSYFNDDTSGDYSGNWTFNATFPVGSAVGNITEVGVGGFGLVPDPGQLVSRALITDEFGSPTSIPVAAEDELTIFYRLQIFPSLIDTTGTVTILGSTLTYTSRLLAAGNAGYSYTAGNACFLNGLQTDASLTNITATVASGTFVPLNGGGVQSAIPLTYSTGTYYRDVNFVVAPQDGNAGGGIKGFYLNSGIGKYQIILNNPIAKTATNSFSITFRQTWGRD